MIITTFVLQFMKAALSAIIQCQGVRKNETFLMKGGFLTTSGLQSILLFNEMKGLFA